MTENIEKNILGARRVDFLKDARNELYDKALKNGKLGVMDYYKMENMIADTNMRSSIAQPNGKNKTE